MDTTTLHLRIFGVLMDVEIPTHRREALVSQWSWCLPDAPGPTTIPGVGGSPVIPDVDPAPPVLRRSDLEEDEEGHKADYRLTTALTATAIKACSGQLLMFHAAGVADTRTGQVAGLIAPSGTGKTTAARVLCSERNLGYVTDETLIVNDAGDVLPYPKPLSVILADGEVSADRRKSQHGPDELGFTRPPAESLRLGPLVVLNRRSEPTPAQLNRISVIEGLKAVLPQSSAVPLVPNCLDVIAELARRAGGFHELTYSEISEAADELLRVFDALPALRDWMHIPGTWPEGTDAPSRFGQVVGSTLKTPLTETTTFVRSRFVDAILTEDGTEALVLLGDLPMHLRGIGAQSWQYLGDPHSAAEVVSYCQEVFGEHPEAKTLVFEALGQLEESGILRRITAPDEEPARPTDR